VQTYRAQNVLMPYPLQSNSDCGFEVGDEKGTTSTGISSSTCPTVDQREIVDALAKHAIYGTV
jgi:hypothetical protein